uniref:Phospholipid-transporting ATPase n=1 Tax=Capra hircus TaxID=9925 RepID=A0A8C2QWV8_CAPHI
MVISPMSHASPQTNVMLFLFQDNRIHTSKYSILTFLPINLFEQFQRVANAYFLFLLILQLIPEISSLTWFTTIVPLVLVVTMTAVKDATDDYHSTHLPPSNILYHETNLKVRHALSVTSELGADISRLAKFDGIVVCEAPNNKLDKFTGVLSWNGSKHSLNNEKIILRGCVLRNTSWCFGMVIFAGPDTKLMQNSGKTKFKRTSIDRLMNTLVLWIFGFLICLGTILAIGNSIWENQVGDQFRTFLFWNEREKNSVFSGFLTFWSYIIILNTVVPISLYVSVEVIRLGHSYFINWDRKMYYSRKATPAEARTTTLNEELGQIEYVFSDKTGTLTQNIMTFKKCSINGRIYGKRNLFFLLLLALCHTVMSEENSAGELIYQVQSPDEGALVTAAKNLGFIFKSRTPETITIEELGTLVTYQLLAFLDFNNFRKRMSVIVRNPEGQIKLYSKGADTILFERLHPSNEDLLTLTSDHLSEFAGEGLRTLAIAYRDLDDKYFREWHKMLEDANTTTDERDERIAGLYEEIERDLMLLGATAVEDKLQDGVIETVTSLSLANIKIWVLTGDKQETAINIGYACNMLTDDMNDVFIIAGNTATEVREELRKAKENLFGRNRSFSNGHVVFEKKQSLELDSVVEETVTGDYALIINGHSLVSSLKAFAHALESDVKNDLLELACMCKTVVCCRVTPLQKAQVVELVKKYRNAVTLAIGDGANDVSMIKSAHIGVGISGQEGLQAVLASDYSFAQFRYLQRLLLVHGRWSYVRMCKFLCYFFYKNFAFTLVHFWFGFFCGFSAQTVYDQWFITLFNIVYTSLPVLAMGIFDQDVSDQNSMDYPQLYKPGQLNLLFNKHEFFICMAHALFFIPYGAFHNMAGEDGRHTADYQSFAVTTATSLVIVVSVQIALDTSYWTVINHVFIWGSIATYFSILFTMHSNGIFGIFPNQFPFVGNARHSLTQKCIWLVILLTTVASVMPVVAFRFLKVDLFPTLSDQIWTQRGREKEKEGTHICNHTRRSSSRRSGYAFAHQEGYGELITSGKNMRAKNPPPMSGLEKTLYNSTSWIENLCKKTTDTVSSFSQDKTVKL